MKNDRIRVFFFLTPVATYFFCGERGVVMVTKRHFKPISSCIFLNTRGSTLQKPRTRFGETRRIPKKPQGFRQNPTETRESPWSWLHRIHKNPLESPGILRNPQEFLGIPRNPQKSWESSEIHLKYFWKPRTKFLKCRAPRLMDTPFNLIRNLLSAWDFTVCRGLKFLKDTCMLLLNNDWRRQSQVKNGENENKYIL